MGQYSIYWIEIIDIGIENSVHVDSKFRPIIISNCFNGNKIDKKETILQMWPPILYEFELSSDKSSKMPFSQFTNEMWTNEINVNVNWLRFEWNIYKLSTWFLFSIIYNNAKHVNYETLWDSKLRAKVRCVRN